MVHVAYLLLATAITGTWEGKTNELPSVELKVRQQGTRVTGTIGFFFQSRGEDGKWRVGPKFEVELLSPKLDGRILTFETIHHKTHDSPELGPNNKYRVEFVSGSEARLHIYTDSEFHKDNGAGLKLTRRE